VLPRFKKIYFCNKEREMYKVRIFTGKRGSWLGTDFKMRKQAVKVAEDWMSLDLGTKEASAEVWSRVKTLKRET
jgi:hypothetical protein